MTLPVETLYEEVDRLTDRQTSRDGRKMGRHGQERLAALLDRLDIQPAAVEHPPVHTVEDALDHWQGLEGEHTKNFFLKDNKGGALYLVTVRAQLRVDLKALAGLLGAKKLSFANAEILADVLGTAAGSVSPLSLVNDTDHQVRFAIDRALVEAPRLTCHPLRNTATLSLTWSELSRLLAEVGVTPLVLDLPPRASIAAA